MDKIQQERMVSQFKLQSEYMMSEKITDKWGCIRQAYMEMIPYIIQQARRDNQRGIDPYFLNWDFTAIERDAWESIRHCGAVLYPQFPLFNYFIDFANPYLKIGLELDGKNYHDIKKDRKRDEMLNKFGWIIYRIKGSECFVKYNEKIYNGEPEEFTIEDIKHWMLNTSDGVINALNVVHFGDIHLNKYKNIAFESLKQHTLHG